MIYIPLCFYFILYSRYLISCVYEFTFHYASTLSHRTVSSRPRVICIYIPLCFYFIGKSGRNDAESKTIYIPLCFYFIFIINVSVSEIDEYFIYIPLCFYFIPPSDHIDFDVFQIYIPLCFYFIDDWTDSKSPADLIYIPLCFYFIFWTTTTCHRWPIYCYPAF